VLKDISFDLKAGEVLSIIGPSGSGKSTLLRCITQLETLDGGQVRVDGMDLLVPGSGVNGNPVKYAPAKVLRQIRLSTGLVFQNFNLFPHLTVLQNLCLAPVRVLGDSRKEARAMGSFLLKRMGLDGKENAYPCELSGGQQQRVSIARALAMNPKILFFDEPTSALDPELTGEVLKIIKKLAEDKMTMVIVTHEMAFARDVADKVVFMDKGVIVEQGTPDHVFNRSNNERLASFLSRFTN
jgi:polar amino acid transport system ATP-binding protein